MSIRSSLVFHLRISGLLLIFIYADCFSLSGVAPKDFQKGDLLKVKVNKLTSIKTLLSHSYYSLRYCRPKSIVGNAENLWEVLRGDRIENSPYVFKMQEPQMCMIVCRIRLDAKGAKNYKKKIDYEYRVNMILDNLPLLVPIRNLDPPPMYHYQHGFHVGFKAQYFKSNEEKEEKYFIYNHLKFTVKYQKDLQTDTARIVGFEVNPFSVKHEYKWDWTRLTTCDPLANITVSNSDSAQEVEENEDIIFTYDVEFEVTDGTSTSQGDTHLKRTLYRDMEMWKLVHGDVVLGF